MDPFKPTTTREDAIKQLRYIIKAAEALLLVLEKSDTKVPTWAVRRITESALHLGTVVRAVRAIRRKS